MNKHSIDYMHECIVNDFNDYENLVICRELVAQLSKRPQPQGMDYDTAENSYVDDLYTACGYNDFCLRELQMSLYPEKEAAPPLYPNEDSFFCHMFDTIFFFLCNRLDDDINSIENTLCADDIQTFLLLVELFARGSSRCEYRGWRESIVEFTKIDKSAVKDAFVASSYLANCYWYGVGVPQSFHQAEFWKQYSLNLLYTYRDFYEDPIDCEGFISGVLDEIGRLSVSCHIQRNLPDALYTDEQWGCISDFGCMPTELVAIGRAEKLDTPYISHTSSLVMQMIQKTSLEELKQMGHTYLNYVRRNSSKNPLEDWKQAVNYYYAGAAQGDAECAAAVGYCCEMDPRGSNLPLALAWYQHAAKAGSAWAMEKVATFYEEGYGCTANRALADACRETLKYMR